MDYKIVYKFLNGIATDEETSEVNRWLEANDRNKAEFEDLKMLWTKGVDISEDDPEFELSFQRIKDELYRRNRKRKMVKTLAILLAVVVIVVWFVWHFYQQGSLDKPTIYPSRKQQEG